MVTVPRDVLIPVVAVVLCLFSYPEPESFTVILSIESFLLYDLILCFPNPNDVNVIVLIPEIASFSVLCKVNEVLLTEDTKYEPSVVIPPIACCPSGL